MTNTIYHKLAVSWQELRLCWGKGELRVTVLFSGLWVQSFVLFSPFCFLKTYIILCSTEISDCSVVGWQARLVTWEEEAATAVLRYCQAQSAPVPPLVLWIRMKLMRITISFLNVEQNTPGSRLFWKVTLIYSACENLEILIYSACENFLLLH